MLLGVLYLVYLFVGDFGASTLVGLLEEDFFGEVLNPAVTDFVTRHISTPWLADLIVGEYGLWTMGMTYALALILPIVTTFFLAFGVLEDSGYFSRLSVIANRMFAAIGLNGRAVLPMVLGLGCVTMATLTTRILHTPRERLITIYLMALAIPCSAQLGVVLGLLGGISFGATVIWVLAIVGVLLFTGWLASKVVPGKRVPLVTELPPMRMPVLGNVLKKTGGRLKWYLIEVIPLFLIGTLIMFGLDRSGALPWIIEAGKPLVVGWLGLPPEASAAFVMGFLRRDFGASGLFALQSELSMIQAVVGMVTITLFVPCIASLMMIIKEQGMKVAAADAGDDHPHRLPDRRPAQPRPAPDLLRNPRHERHPLQAHPAAPRTHPPDRHPGRPNGPDRRLRRRDRPAAARAAPCLRAVRRACGEGAAAAADDGAIVRARRARDRARGVAPHLGAARLSASGLPSQALRAGELQTRSTPSSILYGMDRTPRGTPARPVCLHMNGRGKGCRKTHISKASTRTRPTTYRCRR
ncbi:hypothetical protein MASR2M50_33680 [Thauera sp.]